MRARSLRPVTIRLGTWLATFAIAAACLAPAATKGSISAEAAGRMAIAQTGSDSAKVVSVRSSTYGAEAHGGAAVDPSTPVWAVLLSGSFAAMACGTPAPSPQACGGSPTSALVLIDARTGAFIQAMTPAPSP